MEEMGSAATQRILDALGDAEDRREVSPDLQLLLPTLVLRDSTAHKEN
jgi:DNA-binding LacI/PurR family transcriptional regulator